MVKTLGSGKYRRIYYIRIQKNLYYPLTGERHVDMDQKKRNLLVTQVLGLIRLSLTGNIVFNIIKAKTIVEIMETHVCMRAFSIEQVVYLYLMRKLFNLGYNL